jgi:hypothetical protein
MPKGQYIRNSQSGMSGKQHSAETKLKMRLRKLGKKPSTETLKKLSIIRTGRKLSAEHRKKIADGNRGKKMPKVACEKIRLSMIGNKHSLGRKWSEEEREKHKKTNLGRFQRGHTPWCKGKMNTKIRNNSHWNWKGGTSYGQYSVDWTKTLKRSIRERDKYTCKICGKQQGDKAFDVHHIDYNKKNCNPQNLITLCHSCHCKTNTHHNYWIQFFQKYQTEIGG